MNLPPENDIEYHHFWHTHYWNMGASGTSGTADTSADNAPRKDASAEASTSIIKYQKADWLDGLRERKLPDCLLQWPLIKTDIMA